MTDAAGKPRVLSGIAATGTLHIGNYIGALSVLAQELERWHSGGRQYVTSPILALARRRVASAISAARAAPSRSTVLMTSSSSSSR